MKVKVKYTEGEYGVCGIEIFINGESKFSLGEGEPEDMIFGRNLSDCYNIPEMLRTAYEAGKRGEEFELKGAE